MGTPKLTPMSVVEEFALGRMYANNPSGGRTAARVLKDLLTLCEKAGFGADVLFGLEAPAALKLAYLASSPTRATQIRHVWPMLVEHYKDYDINLPDLPRHTPKGRPPKYSRELYEAVSVLQVAGMTIGRICRLRWVDVDESHDSVIFKMGQFDEVVVVKNEAVAEAMHAIRTWSAEQHRCKVESLKPQWPVIPSHGSPEYCADPRAVYAAFHRFGFVRT